MFIDAWRQWQTRYIPAFVRRYPFVFAASGTGNGGTQTFTLCIDEEFAGCNREGLGARLFDEGGEATPYLQRAIEFAKDYQGQAQQTAAFCRHLKGLDLLRPMKVDLKTSGGAPMMSLQGFMTVDRERLKALAAEQLAELAKTDALELLYLHLHSMRNFAPLAERLAAREAATEPVAARNAGMNDKLVL